MLKFQDIKKVYIASNGEKVEALKNVSIDFSDHGIVFLLGKSGSGKSTMLHILGGLDRPDSGELIVDGHNTSAFGDKDFDFYRNYCVGFVFQELNLIYELNVRENLLLALKLQGKNCSTEELRDVLDKVGMGEYLDRNVSELSGGQRQRIAIARALIKNPRLVLADEPSGALDSETARGVFDLLKELSKDRLVVVASHDRESAEKYGDRIIELKDGKIAKDSNKVSVPVSGSVIQEWAETKKNGFPLSFAAKIAFSNFKKKKFKLVSSVLLAAISFSLFGGAVSFGFIDQSETMTKALKSSYLSSAKIIKDINYVETHKAVFDAYGEDIYEFNTNEPGAKHTLFSDKELEVLSAQNTSVAGVFQIPDSWRSGVERTIFVPEPLDIFYAAGNEYLFSGFSDCGAAYCDAHFELEDGKYPEMANEIAISSHKAEAFLASVDSDGKKLFNSSSDLIGASITLNNFEGAKFHDFTISGIYKTDEIPERFESLKTNLGRNDWELREDYFAFKANSFLDVAFVSEDFFNTNISRYDDDRLISEGVRAKSSVLLQPVESENMNAFYIADSVIPSSFIDKHPTVFDVQDLDGEPLKGLQLKDNQIVVSKAYKNSESIREYEDLYDYLSAFSSALHTSFSNPLSLYSDEVYSLFGSDDFKEKEAAFKAIVDGEGGETITSEYEEIYKYFDDVVDAYFDEMSKRDFLVTVARNHGYIGDNPIDSFIGKLLTDHLTDSELADYRALSSRIMSWEGKEPLSFTNSEWERLESLVADHYQDVHAAYEALSKFKWLMPYSKAEHALGNNENASEELVIAKRINDKYGGDYNALLNDFLADGMSDNDLADMVRCFILGDGITGKMSDFEYGHFDKRVHLSMSSNFQKDGETYDVVGTVSCGADNLDGVIVANPVALKKLGLEIRDDSSIVFDVMDYEYTNEGKYDYLLTSTPKEDGIVKLLNVSFGTYIYKMDDLVSRQVRFAIESTSFTRMILSLVGLVLVVLSAFLLASFINDSVRGKEKEIGILRSMGASRKDVIKTFSIEVLAISLPVALLGNILGWFLVLYGNASYSIKAFTLPLFHYSVLTIFMVIALTLIVSFLSAIWPIEKISRKNVVDAIKGE